MTQITRTRDVLAPPAEVGAFVTDLARWPEWFALHKGWIGDVPDEHGGRLPHHARG